MIGRNLCPGIGVRRSGVQTRPELPRHPLELGFGYFLLDPLVDVYSLAITLSMHLMRVEPQWIEKTRLIL